MLCQSARRDAWTQLLQQQAALPPSPAPANKRQRLPLQQPYQLVLTLRADIPGLAGEAAQWRAAYGALGTAVLRHIQACELAVVARGEAGNTTDDSSGSDGDSDGGRAGSGGGGVASGGKRQGRNASDGAKERVAKRPRRAATEAAAAAGGGPAEEANAEAPTEASEEADSRLVLRLEATGAEDGQAAQAAWRALRELHPLLSTASKAPRRKEVKKQLDKAWNQLSAGIQSINDRGGGVHVGLDQVDLFQNSE